MFKILKKIILHETATLMKIYAPNIAKKVKPGQFIILRINEKGERIPLTVADFDRESGIITIIFQVVGSTTKLLNKLNENDNILDVVGPLGKASKLDNIKKAALIGGGVGCAIAYPIAKYLHSKGTVLHTIAGFRNKNLVILKNEFEAVSNKFILTTDDGSCGEKGLVTDALKRLIVDCGENYDEVIAIGPLVMMKFVCVLTKEYNIKTTVSTNPIMIDGTGMCGGCRIIVDGKTKFACVDGPDFDGHKVDFNTAIKRNKMYEEYEKKEYSKTCNLFKKEQY